MTETSKNTSTKTGAGDLPKRFYEQVKFEANSDGFIILLDGKPVKTPGRSELLLPTEALAEALGEEWSAQLEHIDPATMPLTRLANSSVDLVSKNREQVLDETAKYAGSDLICYRAEQPEELIMKQMAQWNPIIDWAYDALHVDFETTMGVTHIEQPQNAVPQTRRALEDFDNFALMAIHNMTTLTGSILLVLAHISGRFDAVTCWQATHVEEDWQISQWGEDQEAKEARERKWLEMEASSRFFALATGSPMSV